MYNATVVLGVRADICDDHSRMWLQRFPCYICSSARIPCQSLYTLCSLFFLCAHASDVNSMTVDVNLARSFVPEMPALRS